MGWIGVELHRFAIKLRPANGADPMSAFHLSPDVRVAFIPVAVGAITAAGKIVVDHLISAV